MGDQGQELVLGAVGRLRLEALLLLARETDPLVLHALLLDGVADRALQQSGIHLPLDQIIRRSGPHRLEVDLQVPLARHQDDGSRAVALARRLQQLEPGPGPQAEIEQRDVEVVASDPLDRRLVARHPLQLETVAVDLVQEVSREDVVVLIILDEKNPYAFHGRLGSRLSWEARRIRSSSARASSSAPPDARR